MWKFNWVPRPEERPMDFYKTEFPVSAWKDIPVPSNWEVEGYGTPHYRNNGYIFKKDWPRVMTEPPANYTAFKERNPVGSYRRDFDVPKDWSGRRVLIQFDGVDSAFFLWINGTKVGYSVNSRNAAEFDITPYVKPGKNTVAVEVYRFSAGSYLEDQDMWRLSGIFRNVTLWSTPKVHLRDFFAKPDLDAQYLNGSVNITAKIRNYEKQPSSAQTLKAGVYDSARKLVAEASASVPALAPGEEKEVSLKVAVSNPAKWTAETPNLYTTVLTLEGNGGEKEFISCRTGFRKVEIKGYEFLVNGVPIKLKGVNRHENWPDSGHYITEERMKRELDLLKQGNCNNVRTSHYSNDPRWYELCDEYGIYLTAEANMECHGYQPILDHEPRWERAIVDRNVANVENFKNHPSVIIWSLGNESGEGPNFISALKKVKEIDPERPVHFESFGMGKKNPADIDSRMYLPISELERCANDPTLTKPFYLCEYAHAMFNSMGSLGDYNDVFDKYPKLLGGAIWEWSDQGLWNRRDPSHPILAYGGGFGEFPNDHYFIHKGVVFSDRSPKPHFPEMKQVYQWVAIQPVDLASGTVKIRNKYQFLNLENFAGLWTISEDGREIASGKLEDLAIAPGKEKLVTIPFGKVNVKPGAEYFLRVAFALKKDELWAKAGYEIASEQMKLPIGSPAPVATQTMAPVKLQQDEKHSVVVGKDFTVSFDKSTGRISQITRDGTDLLVPGRGPELQLWRAPHQKDDMWAYAEWTKYGLPELAWQTVKFSAEASGETSVRVTAILKGEGKNQFSVTHTAVYTVYGDGSIVVDNAVVPVGPRISLARLGVRMVLDPRDNKFTYLGRGPMENYADRKRGFDVGLYSSSVQEQMTPYAKPMECGNHEDVRWAAVTGGGVPGLLVQAVGGLLQVSAIPYTDEQMTPVEYTIDLPPSIGTVLTIAAKTLGVGSGGCGHRPLEPYFLWSDPATFAYALRILPAGIRDISGREAIPADAKVRPVLGKRDENSRVILTCETPDAKIEYSEDGKAWKVFSGPFEMQGQGIIFVRATQAGSQGYEGAISVGLQDRRSAGWKIVSASSFQEGEGAPVNVLDGDPQTYWHSEYKPSQAKHPHWLEIDFGKTIKVSAILYRSRQGVEEGRVKEYEIFLSQDGKQWGDPVKGVFENREGEQQATLPTPVEARYLKFVALSEVKGNSHNAISELDVITAK
jgi:beta-galactosidase